jgi:hypothetical protein
MKRFQSFPQVFHRFSTDLRKFSTVLESFPQVFHRFSTGGIFGGYRGGIGKLAQRDIKGSIAAPKGDVRRKRGKKGYESVRVVKEVQGSKKEDGEEVNIEDEGGHFRNSESIYTFF